MVGYMLLASENPKSAARATIMIINTQKHRKCSNPNKSMSFRFFGFSEFEHSLDSREVATSKWVTYFIGFDLFLLQFLIKVCFIYSSSISYYASSKKIPIDKKLELS